MRPLRSWVRRIENSLPRPGKVMLILSVVLPFSICALALSLDRSELLQDARTTAQGDAAVAREFALKALETHDLVIDNINAKIRSEYLPDDRATSELTDILAHLSSLPQISNIAIVDSEGMLMAASRPPANGTLDFSDRDWFKALRDTDTKLFISRSYLGRISNRPIFNIAKRIAGNGDGRFLGGVNVSVNRSYFEGFFCSLLPQRSDGYKISMARLDGYVLAECPFENNPNTDKILLPEDAEQNPSGSYVRPQADGKIGPEFIYSRVGDYPVLILCAINRDAALVVWRRHIVQYGALAAAASTLLLLVSAMALSEASRVREASFGWQRTAERLQEEIAVRVKTEQALAQAKKMEAVGNLTGGIAHDFNNLLTVIIGNVEALRDLPDLRSEARALSDVVLKAASTGAALTRQLLAFARRQPLSESLTDLNEATAAAVTLIRRTLPSTIHIELSGPSHSIMLMVDQAQLSTALINLSLNARDAMPAGGRLTFTTAVRDIIEENATSIDPILPGRYAVLSVRDSGAGMTPEVRAKAIEPFFSTKATGHGTGLGLSMVYGLVRQSGGYLTIESAPGNGTTIELLFPLVDAAPATSPRAATRSLELVRPSGRRVLVVDDLPDVLKVVSASLTRLGYEVVAAMDGPAALEALEHDGHIDVLLTDLGLPGGMTGLELATRAAERYPSLKIATMSGYNDTQALGLASAPAGWVHLGKPVRRADLQRALESLLAEEESHASATL